MACAFERDSAHEVEPPSQEEKFEYLTERVGPTLQEAEQILADDVFLTDSGFRYGFEPEETAKVWAEAQEKLEHLAEAALTEAYSATSTFRCYCRMPRLGLQSYASGPRSGPGSNNNQRFTRAGATMVPALFDS